MQKSNQNHCKGLLMELQNHSLMQVYQTNFFFQIIQTFLQNNLFENNKNGVDSFIFNIDLAKKEDGRDIVTLHMTLLNVKYLKKAKHKSFDARHILEQYADFDFGCQEVKQIHLAVMSQKDPHGFYKCISSIEF